MTGDPRSAFDLLARDGETRRLFLRNYRVLANIGIHDFEKQGPQALLINVELYLKPPAAALGDDVGNTLDYDFLRDGIARLVARQHYNLQETLVHAILDLCLALDQVLMARVSSEKPDVYPDCDAVGYEATRLR